jgi:hypothetical protein
MARAAEEQTLIDNEQTNFFVGPVITGADDESVEAYGGAGGCGGVRLMRRESMFSHNL